MSNENISFARGIDTTELRGDCPRSIVNVLDAVSIARGISRNALVNEVLGNFVSNKVHEASLINRLASEYPHDADEVTRAARELVLNKGD